MRRWLPHPLMSAVLAVVWLLLTEPSLPHLLLAVLLAVAIPLLVHRFLDQGPARVRGWRGLTRAAGFALVVLWDIVVANVAVARLVLGPPARLRPAFVEVPVELEQPLALTLLASIVTMTPGTVSAQFSADRRRLLVHVLDTDDPARLAAHIKARYERPLGGIFE
jgi:multicomponent K+:H+ antiporter subunit E